jgi:hypothetical protein
VPALLDNVNTCTEKTNLLEIIVKTGLDLILPLRLKTVHLNDPPWFSSTLKNLIKRHQRALTKGDSSEFHILKNHVNCERKICRARYYEAKVAYLKDCKPSSWWKEIKKLSGMSPVSGGRNDNILESLQHIDGVSNAKDLANVINDSFIQPVRVYSPLPANFQLERDTPSHPPPPPCRLSTFRLYEDVNVRVVLFDYKKAFDLIDHTILIGKLKKLDLHYEIICWIVDFLKCRKQRIKLTNDCKSEWINVPAGVPQGTKLQSWTKHLRHFQLLDKM